MYSNEETYEVTLNSVADINMSNWQITKTLDTITMVNNKFVILALVNDLISKGVEKKNIFVTDKSFLISTNYRTYYEKGNVFCGENDAVKMYSLGKFISMEPNEDISKINSLFELYQKLNSIVNKHLRSRIRNEYLANAYLALFDYDIEYAYNILADGVKQQVNLIFERYLSPDYIRLQSIVDEISKQVEKCSKTTIAKYEKNNIRSKERFEYTFNRFDRPIVGVYKEQGHLVEILNYDQMYKNGEEANRQIKLNCITKNSPVMIAFLVTGPMVGFLAYLMYREHKVNTQPEWENTLDIPQTDDNAVENILGCENGSLIDYGQEKKIDSQVTELAKENLNKLQVATSKRILHMEMNIEIGENS